MTHYWLLALSVVACASGCESATTQAHDTPAALTADSACAKANGLSLQVLGSGGPIADDARAGTGYVVWHDGRSRFLIDAGSGTMARFGSAGGTFADLDAVALSHYHVDHTSDLPALLKSGYFSHRTRPLPISGPDGKGPFPGLEAFLTRLVGRDGAYAYLSGYLDGTAGLVRLDRHTVPVVAAEPTVVYVDEGAALSALGVPHAIVPALAFRLDIAERSIVFAGDQSGGRDGFVQFARGADILVMHMVVPEGITGAGRRLHAPPSRIGQIAAKANPDTLVLSHFMARSLRDLEQNVALIRKYYKGRVVLAEDLLCVAL